MRQKQLLMLTGALVLLLLVAYLTGTFERNVSTVDVPALDIPADALDEVRLAWSGGGVTLRREGETWRISAPVEAAVDTLVVGQLVRSLGSLGLESVVSTNPDRYARYGVDSAATTLTASWEGTERRLSFADQGPDYQSVYVRLDDDPRVFATRGRLSAAREVDRWRDKTMLSLPYQEVAVVTVSRPEGGYEVAYGSTGWQLTENGTAAPADSAGVVTWLRRFATLKADGFLDDQPAADVQGAATHHITFRTTGGSTQTLWLQEIDDAVAATTGSGPTYKLFSYRLDPYLPQPNTLKATE